MEMTAPTQQQWREMMDRVLRTWAGEMAGELMDNETYKAAEKLIADSEAADAFVILDAELQQIMPQLPKEKRDIYLPFLRTAMFNQAINTPKRAAAFLAQLAHESAELKYFEEIWGPTSAQKRYEGRADLGNTEPGDGYRFRGRGPIQLTGRANYKTFGDLLGVDFVANPDLAATPEWGFLTAALFWKRKGLNELADIGHFVTITRRINGGVNGLEERERYYEVAKKALGVSE
jgi:predicted chitinase